MKVPSDKRDCLVCGEPDIAHVGSYVFWCRKCGSLDDCCTVSTPTMMKGRVPDGSKMVTPETLAEVLGPVQ